jgi:hypothetical protein
VNRNLRVIVLSVLFCLTIIPSEAVCATFVLQKIPSYDFIVNGHNTQITLVQGDEDFYVVSQNSPDSDITDSNQNSDFPLIFGEDAITEDNILKHYIFNKTKIEKNKANK